MLNGPLTKPSEYSHHENTLPLNLCTALSRTVGRPETHGVSNQEKPFPSVEAVPPIMLPT